LLKQIIAQARKEETLVEDEVDDLLDKDEKNNGTGDSDNDNDRKGKGAEKKVTKKLVEKEEIAEGRVRLSIYITYVKATYD
jgi:chromatin remodeling complex protein RSC6